MIYSHLFRRLAGSAVFALLFHAGVLSQAQDLPKAPQSQIFALTPTVGPFTEPAIRGNRPRTWTLRTTASPATCR
jgi:hypothetical protein